MKGNIEDAIKKYIEDKYGHGIGEMLDRLESEGFYDDPNDISGEKFSKAITEFMEKVIDEEGIMKDSCYDKVVEGMVSLVAWEYAGLELKDKKIIYRP